MNMKDSEKLTYIKPQADIIDIEYPDVLCAGSCTHGCSGGQDECPEVCSSAFGETNCDIYDGCTVVAQG